MLRIIGVELAFQDQHPKEGQVNSELAMFSCDLKIPDHPKQDGYYSYAQRELVITVHTSHGDKQARIQIAAQSDDRDIHRANAKG
jgi:hypothetical protein